MARGEMAKGDIGNNKTKNYLYSERIIRTGEFILLRECSIKCVIFFSGANFMFLSLGCLKAVGRKATQGEV